MRILKIIYLFYVLAIGVFGYFQKSHAPSVNAVISDPNIYLLGNFQVKRIVDGDTIHVTDNFGKEDIVRFLAVNTLEMTSTSSQELCFAKEEKEFTRENLESKDIELWGDKTQPERDKYKRLLAYVRISDATSSDFFNDILMKTGNAKVYRASPPAVNFKKYLEYEHEAQASNLGMWKKNSCK